MINKELSNKFRFNIKEVQESLLKIAEIQLHQIREATRIIQKFLDQIDLELLEQTFIDSYGYLGKQAEIAAKHNLFLNINMLDDMTLPEIPDVLNSKWIIKWMQIHYDEKVAELISDNFCFGDTTILLKQSYNAYLREDYAISFITLYPVIDSFVSHWYTSIDGEVKISPNKHIKETLNSGERNALELLFISYALHAYSLMNSNKGHYGFKRHHALHGSLQYTRIQRQDCIKLF